MAQQASPAEDDELFRSESAQNAFQKTVQSINRESVRYSGDALSTPWFDEDGNLIWSRRRVMAAQLVRSAKFDTCMGVVIVLNICIMVYEANTDASCYPEYEDRLSECKSHSDNIPLIGILNYVFLMFYTIEAGVRVFVDQRDYIFNSWNQLDTFLVVVGWMSAIMESFVNVSFLRVLRLSRLLRAMRVLMSIRELYLLMTGFVTSLRAIFFGAVCLFCALSLWAIIAVQVLHPVNASISYDGCERCSRGFQSVQSAILTFFQQTVAGDSWGQISMPVIEKAPWSGLILASVLISIGLGVMNLILAVIVERAAEARENDVETRLREKDAERRYNMLNLAKLCHEIDYNGSGTLSLDNFLEGMENSRQFAKLLKILDLEKSDIESIFHVLDMDKSGDVSYFEFCDAINKASKRDLQMMSSLIKFSIAEVKALLERDINAKLDNHTALLQQILLRVGADGGESANVSRPKLTKEEERRASNGIGHQEAKIPNDSLSHQNGVATTFGLDTLQGPIEDFHGSIHGLVAQVTAQTDAMSQAEKHLLALQTSLGVRAEERCGSLKSSSQHSAAELLRHTQLSGRLSEIQSKICESVVADFSLLARKKYIQSWLMEQIYQEEIPRIVRVTEPSKDVNLSETGRLPTAAEQLQPTFLSGNSDDHAVRV
eukprot:TRINITY_DN41817_c0_g1_i1.p1 TRINITY_DN41817_c0_g1~~TRINITY_DN41817_c0_g1_i1.p1  ORF type:complete len:660 (+),score=90.55 TRINITY_DN41817_c0_g1_i1:40-2019(+)